MNADASGASISGEIRDSPLDAAGEGGGGGGGAAAAPPPPPIPWTAALSASPSGGDSVRSYAWYPRMTSSVPSSCAFLAACRDRPVHLVDAYDGSIRASYRPYNGLDEMESPAVVSFDPTGERVFASGFRTDRTVHVFRTDRPGRESELLRLGKTRRSRDGQKGVVSSLAFPPDRDAAGPSVFAVGTYSPGSIYVYDDRTAGGTVGGFGPEGGVLSGGVCVVGHGRSHARKRRRFDGGGSGDGDDDDECGGNGNGGEDMFSAAKARWYHARARTGVTQLRWSPSPSGPSLLYSASRKSDAVIAWDLRALSGDSSRPVRGVASYPRDGDTNQRLGFDLDEDGNRLFACGADGTVRTYDVRRRELLDTMDGFDDVPNGVSYFDAGVWGRRGGLLSVATGSRRFEDTYDEGDDDGREDPSGSTVDDTPGSLEIYRV